MTLLDEIIDASTDTSVAASDLLRKVQVVAHRLGAADVVRWVKSELTGYEPDADLPTYRVLHTPVMGTFTGPMRSTIQHQLTIQPTEMEPLWTVKLREPLTELQALSELEKDPGREWPAIAVQMYEQSGVFRMEFHGLFSAHNVITRQSLRGILDIVRSKAMEFALELQTDYPEAGTQGGPTIASEPGLSSAVFHVTNNIYGDGVNVATGSQITQKSRVSKGDVDALRREARALGLPNVAVEEFIQVVDAELAVDKPRFLRFVEKVRTGAIVLGGSVASDVAASTLIELAKAYLGLS